MEQTTFVNDKGETVQIEKLENTRLIHSIAKYAEMRGKDSSDVKALKAEALRRMYKDVTPEEVTRVFDIDYQLEDEAPNNKTLKAVDENDAILKLKALLTQEYVDVFSFEEEDAQAHIKTISILDVKRV